MAEASEGQSLKHIVQYTAYGLLAAVLALLSLFIVRTGPDEVSYGNMCGPRFNEECYQPALRAGFPLTYVEDSPGISVENKLGLEDKISIKRLIIDISIYAALLACVHAIHRKAILYRPSRADPDREQ